VGEESDTEETKKKLEKVIKKKNTKLWIIERLTGMDNYNN
jgi:hypothetical protein